MKYAIEIILPDKQESYIITFRARKMKSVFEVMEAVVKGWQENNEGIMNLFEIKGNMQTQLPLHTLKF